MRRLVEASPGSSPEQIGRSLLDEVREDDDLLLPILIYWVRHNMRALSAEPTQIKEKATKRRKRESAVRKKVESRAKIIFMQMIAPNGKILADCTGKECSKFGGFFSAVGKEVKPTETVGGALSEQQLVALWRKHR